MVDEIAANRLAQEQLPDSHPARIFGQTVEAEKSEAIKQKQEELELTELDGKIKRARLEAASKGVLLHFRTMKQLELPLDDRDPILSFAWRSKRQSGRQRDLHQDHSAPRRRQQVRP